MVESQLISDPNPHEPKLLDELIALQFFNEIKKDKCRNCLTPLPKKEIYHYRHRKGWVVPGYEEKQWLFIVCPKCNHQWSLWKLGFSRDTKIKIENTQKENLQTVWNEKSHPGAIEENLFSNKMLLGDLGKACIEKVELQGKLAQIQIFIENRLIELAKEDPNWNVDYIPEKMLKRYPEINSLNSILNLLKSH